MKYAGGGKGSKTHQETFVKDILLVSRSSSNNLSVLSFMFQTFPEIFLIKSVTKSLAANKKKLSKAVAD